MIQPRLPDVLSLSLPASDLHIHERSQKDHAWIMAALRRSVAQARAQNISFISLGPEDATRTDREFIKPLANIARECGIQRLRLAIRRA